MNDPNATLPEDSKADDHFGETVIGSSVAALDATLLKDGAAQANDPEATVIEKPKGGPDDEQAITVDRAADAAEQTATFVSEGQAASTDGPAAISSGQRRYELIANFARGRLGKIGNERRRSELNKSEIRNKFKCPNDKNVGDS